MTLPTDKATITLNGNGANKAFDFDFLSWEEDEFEVWISINGAVATEVLTDWTVVLNPDQDAAPGGTLTYPVVADALTLNDSITIKRSMPFIQEVDLVNNTAFEPEVIETALDKAAAERQELREEVSRAIKYTPGNTGSYRADDIDEAVDACQASEAGAEDARDLAEIYRDEAQAAAQNLSIETYETIAVALQTDYTMPFVMDTTFMNVDVHVDGIKQLRSTFSLVDSTTVRFDVAPAGGAELDFLSLDASGAIDIDSLNVIPISDYGNNLYSAVLALGATETTLFIDAPTLVSQNTIVPETLTLWFVGEGAYLYDDSSNANVTINGSIRAGINKIFSFGNGTGRVILDEAKIDKAYPQWWYSGTGYWTDAFQRAVVSIGERGGELIVPIGLYEIDDEITVAGPIKIIGEGTTEHGVETDCAVIKQVTDTKDIFYCSSSTNVEIENLSLTRTNTLTGTASGVHCYATCIRPIVRRCSITEFTYAIHLEPDGANEVSEARIVDNYKLQGDLWAVYGDSATYRPESILERNNITDSPNGVFWKGSRICNNTFTGIGDSGAGTYYALDAVETETLMISGNVLTSFVVDNGSQDNIVVALRVQDTVKQCSISDNMWDGNGAILNGIDIANSTEADAAFLVVNNIFRDITGTAISVGTVATGNTKIGGNSVTDCSEKGIYCAAVNSTINDNSLNDCGEEGIDCISNEVNISNNIVYDANSGAGGEAYISATGDNNLITNNNLIDGGNLVTGIIASGTNVLVTGNGIASCATPITGTSLIIDNPGDEVTHTASGALTTHGVSDLDSSGGALAMTLADGLVIGQRKTINMSDATNSSTVTIASYELNSSTPINFSTVTDSLVLEWTGSAWTTLSSISTLAEETVTGSGALSIYGISYLETVSTAYAISLADGVEIGQKKQVLMTAITSGLGFTLTVTNPKVSSPSSHFFRTVGDYMEFEWLGSTWLTTTKYMQ